MSFWSWHTWLVHRSGRDWQREEEVWSGLAGTAGIGVGGRGSHAIRVVSVGLGTPYCARMGHGGELGLGGQARTSQQCTILVNGSGWVPAAFSVQWSRGPGPAWHTLVSLQSWMWILARGSRDMHGDGR